MSQACEECGNRCMLIHKQKRDPSSIVSSCFKVMINENFWKFLPLPPKFAKTIASMAGKETWVEDSSGRKWTLRLSADEGQLGFGRGWDAFASDHEIKFGEFVIIHYILNSHFIVQIYGLSGCEKLILPSKKTAVLSKRGRRPANPVAKVDCGSKEKKEILEEPLMMLNRDTPGEWFDVIVSEVANYKLPAAGEVDNGQNGKLSANAEDAKMDELNNMMQFERAASEKLQNVISNDEDMLLDFDPVFEDFLGNPVDWNMSEINEKKHEEFKWKPEIDELSNTATKDKSDILTMNNAEFQSGHDSEVSKPLAASTDFPSRASNENDHDIKKTHVSAPPRAQIATLASQIAGKNAVSKPMEPVSANDGSHSKSIRYTPVKGSIGNSVKVVKTEPKEFNGEQVGNCYKDARRLDFSDSKNPNAATRSAKVRKTVKTESVDYTPLEVNCFMKPNSSFLEIRKALPAISAEVEVMMVLLKDSGGRRWPVLYHHNYGLKGLGYGWGSFSKANGIRSGDVCVFTLEDQFEFMYSVQVNHKQVKESTC